MIQQKDIQEQINHIRRELLDTFNETDTWFDVQEDIRVYKPKGGGWSIGEILEHIGLTNHYLLILIEKGTKKALRNINNLDLQTELKNYTFQQNKLTEVGMHKSFTWIRPEHMEPRGEKSPEEVRQQIKSQTVQCLDVLERLKNGEGVLYKTTMSVNDLGKIDVYEYIYFLARHARRHLTQMEGVREEYGSNNLDL
ncbi:MAG: DinB family protein [Cyclobacteriaceae bacterium]|nr:DinB family protein [Cyclobacteriaceae bacterium]